MNVVLWAIQIILAIKLVTVTYTHGIRPNPDKMTLGRTRFGARQRPLLAAIALVCLAAALCLVSPALAAFLGAALPWIAAVVALLMIVSAAFHASCQEHPKFVVSAVLGLMAAFLAYGRWSLSPL
jgi:hypothetical protein